MPETYYDRLGVTPDATTAEITNAYRERLKEAHPDVSDDPDAADLTKGLVEAKEILTDEAERDRYDRLGHERYVESHDPFVEPTDEDVARSRPTDGEGPAGETRSGRGAGSASQGRDVGGSDGEWGTSDPRQNRGTAAESGEWGRADPTDHARAERDRRRGERAQRRRQNRETRAGWNTAGGTAETEAGETAETEGGGTYARRWRAWDTDAPYRVHTADRTSIGSRLFPPGPSLVLLAVGFAIYPVLLWATLEPAFPLAVNLVLGICLLFLVVFLVGMPAVGVLVFGAWTFLLPAALTVVFGVPPLSLPWLLGLGGTVLPLGLAVLIFVALRG